jgi:CHASE2 domain-containing sensor protein
VATKSSSKNAQFWRSDWFAGAAIVVAVMLLNQVTDVIGSLERKFYDVASTSSARQPSDRVAIIAIDDQSIANIGRWPWPRDVHAKLIDQLAEAKAKTIVHTVFFIEPQVDRGLSYIRKMKSLLGASGDAAANNVELNKVIADAELALDTDAVLAASMKKAGNVLVPSVFSLGEPQGNPDKPLPAYALKSAIDEKNGSPTRPSVASSRSSRSAWRRPASAT